MKAHAVQGLKYKTVGNVTKTFFLMTKNLGLVANLATSFSLKVTKWQLGIFIKFQALPCVGSKPIFVPMKVKRQNEMM